MDEVEQVDRGEVPALDEPDLERTHEPRGRHREIVAHQHEALDVGPVTLPQGPDELAFALVRLVVGVEPLLELVEHDQDLLPLGQ